MGLDMYLERDWYTQNWDHYGPERVWDISVRQGGDIHPLIDPSRIVGVTEQVCYWRKANAIHDWFVVNCQNGVDECQRTPVPVEKLIELLGLVNTVLEDPDLGPTLLPTSSGFFFGDTKYDEYYLEDMKHTSVSLTELDLGEPLRTAALKWGLDGYYYQSSW